MYEIKTFGFGGRKKRLVSDTRLTRDDFEKIVAAMGGQSPIRARKLGYLAAYRIDRQCDVATEWQGESTVNVAEPGDWIVVRLNKSGTAPDTDDNGKINIYVVKHDAFVRLNRRAPILEIRHPMIDANRAVPVFQGRATVEAILFSRGLDILAPWNSAAGLQRSCIPAPKWRRGLWQRPAII